MYYSILLHLKPLLNQTFIYYNPLLNSTFSFKEKRIPPKEKSNLPNVGDMWYKNFKKERTKLKHESKLEFLPA